jgi:restriction endonuclease S subunit
MSRSPLKGLANVQMGYSFRTGVQHNRDGSVRVIQMRDLNGDRVADIGLLGCTDMDVPEAQQVHKGDIIFRSRGDTATAAILDADPGVAVVAAPLLRVRIADDRVLPAYLTWYLNQPPAQAYLAKNSEGSNVKMISKRALEELEVTVPAIARQERIVALALLTSREKELAGEITARRDRFLSEVMVNYAEGSVSR